MTLHEGTTCRIIHRGIVTESFKAGTFGIIIPISFGSRLDHEDQNTREKKWDAMDIMEQYGRP